MLGILTRAPAPPDDEHGAATERFNVLLSRLERIAPTPPGPNLFFLALAAAFYPNLLNHDAALAETVAQRAAAAAPLESSSRRRSARFGVVPSPYVAASSLGPDEVRFSSVPSRISELTGFPPRAGQRGLPRRRHPEAPRARASLLLVALFFLFVLAVQGLIRTSPWDPPNIALDLTRPAQHLVLHGRQRSSASPCRAAHLAHLPRLPHRDQLGRARLRLHRRRPSLRRQGLAARVRRRPRARGGAPLCARGRAPRAGGRRRVRRGRVHERRGAGRRC